jgi:CubicO group peptidase (beta-lactamase class C family)
MITTTRAELGSSLLDTAYATIADAVESGALPSGVLAIASSDTLLRLEAFGPVATDSIFLIASITKPIFATSLMRLVERGRILLNEPIERHLPEFGANGKADVRLWHLLTHTSGLNDGWVELARGPERWEWPRYLARVCEAPLSFRPGTRYSYCNPSFFVMAELVQRLTGQDHASYLQQSVFEPLGMRDTSFKPPESSRVVSVLDPPWLDDERRPRWIALRRPDGGLWSTAADLVRFGQALLRDGRLDDYQLIAPATLRAMTSLQTAGIPAFAGGGEFQSYYGLGFSKAGPHGEPGPSPELRSPAGFGHGGATGTYLWIEPEFDLVFVFLTNRWGQDETTMKRALNVALAAASLAAT